jgi:hypothetical protein
MTPIFDETPHGALNNNKNNNKNDNANDNNNSND